MLPSNDFFTVKKKVRRDLSYQKKEERSKPRKKTFLDLELPTEDMEEILGKARDQMKSLRQIAKNTKRHRLKNPYHDEWRYKQFDGIGQDLEIIRQSRACRKKSLHGKMHRTKIVKLQKWGTKAPQLVLEKTKRKEQIRNSTESNKLKTSVRGTAIGNKDAEELKNFGAKLFLLEQTNAQLNEQNHNSSAPHKLEAFVRETTQKCKKVNKLKTSTSRKVSRLMKANTMLTHNGTSESTHHGAGSSKLETERLVKNSMDKDMELRNNLVVFGLEDSRTEQPDETLAKILDFFNSRSDMQLKNTDIEKASRISIYSPVKIRPVRVQFFSVSMKDAMLRSSSRNRKDTRYISEDFCLETRIIRSKLWNLGKAERAKGKKISLVYKHLKVDGEEYELHPDGLSIRKVDKNAIKTTPDSQKTCGHHFETRGHHFRRP